MKPITYQEAVQTLQRAGFTEAEIVIDSLTTDTRPVSWIKLPSM